MTTPIGKTQPLLQWILLVFFTLLLFPAEFYIPPATGLDPSWNIALHLAWKYHLVFGKDVVFTYGPLGIFQSRLPVFASKFAYLLFDAYFVVTLFFVMRSVFKRHFSYSLAAFVFLCVITAQYGGPYDWYFFFFFFFLFSFVEDPNRLGYLAHAGLLSVALLYFKISLGLTAVFLFVAATTFVLVRRRWSLKRYLASIFSYSLVIWVSALVFRVNLKGYILGSLQLIDGYNDAMFRPIDREYWLFLLISALVVIGFLIRVLYLLVDSIRRKEWVQNAETLFIQAVTGMGIFVLFKSAFVRSDSHAFIFFKNITPLAGFAFLYVPKHFKAKRIGAWCWIVLALSFWAVNSMPGSYQPYLRVLKLSFLSLKYDEMRNYFSQVGKYDKAKAAADSLESGNNEYKANIGSHSVDVIPSEISTLYFNGLHYNPRPVIQSYAAYTSYLDDLNRRKYESPDGPDYILFSVATIDGRVPFFDESRTKLAVLGRYTVAGEIRGDLVLKKRMAPAAFQPLLTDTLAVKLGENVPVRKTPNLLFSRIFIRYNPWGAAKRLFYQPPYLKITLMLDNGESRTFRAIKPVLEDGVILNKFLESEDEFQLLQQADGRLNTNVISVRFECDDAGGGFEPTFKMVNTYYAFPDKTVEQRRADSLGIARLYDRYNSLKPVLLDTSHCLKDSLLFATGSVTSNSHLIRITDGWAFRVKGKNDSTTVSAVLRSEGRVYMLPSKTQARPDLPFVFGRRDVANSGFLANVSKSLLPPGEYQLGVLISDTVLHHQWLRFSDSRMTVLRDPQISKIDPPDAEPPAGDLLKVGMNPLKEDDYKAYVGGWAFLPKEDTAGAITSLVLRSKDAAFRVSTNPQSRPDVAASFGNARLEKCGFYVEIPKDALPEGLYLIYVERQVPGRHERYMTGTVQAIKVNMTEVSIPSPLKQLPPAGDFTLGVDYVKSEGDTLTVSGWALRKPGEADSSNIDILLKNGSSCWRAATQIRYRPDVTQLFKGKFDYDFSGFYAKIPTKALPPGTWQPAVRIYQMGMEGVMKDLGQPIVLHLR